MQSSGPINLAEALGIIRRRALLIVLCTLLVAAAAYGFSKSQTKEYTATASLVFSDNPLSEQIVGLPPSTTTNLLAQHASNVALVSLGDTAARTARQLGNGLTESEVRDGLAISGAGESNVVAVSSTATSALLAARIATTYSREFVKQQRKANDRFFESALALVNRQIEELPVNRQFSPAAIALQNRAQSLRLLKELRYGNVSVAQKAPVPLEPSAPKTSRNTVIGGLLGLLLGLGLAFVLERFRRERRIMSIEDLEETYRLPLLGSVPESVARARAARQNGQGGVEMTPAETEAFSLIRARMRLSKPELRTVLVTSATRGDGRTTVARCLAEAAAGMSSRVLLLEADLRNPTLAWQMGIQPELGLQGVLAGATPVYEAIRSVQLEGPFGGRAAGRTLDVLACGSTLPSNPGQLLESPAMDAVLDHVKSTYDLVVIDAPPVTAVSDAFSLLHRVDGVMVVGWIGRSPRDLAEQLHETLEGSGAVQVGVIANGASSAPRGSDAYPHEDGSFKPMPAAPPVEDSRPGAPVPTPKP